MAAQKRKGADRVVQSEGCYCRLRGAGRGPSAIHGDGTEREPPSCRRAPLFRSLMQVSLNNENLYGFICLLGTTLFANRRGVRRPVAARAQHTVDEIGNPDGQKPENKISRRDEKFPANLAGLRSREAMPKYLVL